MSFLPHFLNSIHITDPNINIWVGLLILLDIFLIILIIHNTYSQRKILQGRDEKTFKQEAENIRNEIKDALASQDAVKKGLDEEIKKIEDLLRQARDAEMNLSAIAAEDIIQDVKDAVKELDAKIKTIGSLLAQAQEVEGKLASHKQEMDRYGEAIRLISEGLAIEDVAKKLDIPRGEIELVMGLKSQLDTRSK